MIYLILEHKSSVLKREGTDMVTQLGKALRAIRLERGEVLKDMAQRLSISTAYLSAIENGKRRASEEMIEKIKELYSLDEQEQRKLEEAWIQSIDEVTINLQNSSGLHRDLGVVFARRFDGLSTEEIEKVMQILRKDGNG